MRLQRGMVWWGTVQWEVYWRMSLTGVGLRESRRMQT